MEGLAVEVEEEFVCCWGLIPPSFVSMQAYLWMWASPLLQEHQFVFIRHSQRQVEEMQADDAKNDGLMELAILYLQTKGAKR